MAEETGKISGAGQGFFKADGTLKTKEELNSKQTETNTKQSEEPVETSFKSDVTNVLSKVENRFIEQANNALETVSRQQDNLKDARSIVNEQLSTAKDLKAAIKDGDEERANQLRENLQQLNERRVALSEKIEKDNRQSTPERKVQLRLGNEEVAKVDIREARLKADKNFDAQKIDKTNDVNEIIDDIQKDKESIKQQLNQLRETKGEIRDAVKAAKSEIQEVRKNSIATFEDAEKLTSKVSKEIQSGGISVLEKTISTRLSPDLVSRFLQ